jgi:DNA-binding transcriptional regulator YiaG
LIKQLLLEALEPAALDASLQAANDLANEREVLNKQWQQRVERARYEAERAHRQYDAVEPENRLVARTLERQWEQALAEQMQLEAEHERFRREQPQALTPAEITAIQHLAKDLPLVWQSATQEERQTIVRLMLERILVEVIDHREQVRVECHWHGGARTSHQLTRPVARLDQLSSYKELLGRAGELHREGRSLIEIADILNREQWRPPKRRDTFNAPMIHRLLLKGGVRTPKYRRRKQQIQREPDEWTIPELARHLGVPESTLYNWVQHGRLRRRQIQMGTRHAVLVHADEAAIAALKAILATPIPWRRLPPRQSSPTIRPTES